MDSDEFETRIAAEFERLGHAAKSTDELSSLFAILGINSGEEDAGWQPIGETEAFVQDFTGLINAPVSRYTKIRLALSLYCHITEANYVYHTIYNLLLAADGQAPKVFNFLDKYRKAIPPSFATKMVEIAKLAKKLEHDELVLLMEEIVDADVRNAFFHSDYILYEDELRLKHLGSKSKRIGFAQVGELLEKTLIFFHRFREFQGDVLSSYTDGQLITGRISPDGRELASFKVIVRDGVATGFSSSDSRPLW